MPSRFPIRVDKYILDNEGVEVKNQFVTTAGVHTGEGTAIVDYLGPLGPRATNTDQGGFV